MQGSLASWVERETIYLWLWSFCAGGRRFAPRPWHYYIVGGDFHPMSQLARFSPPNMPFILNLFRISLGREAINYRPFAAPSFEVSSHIKKTCHFGHYYKVQTLMYEKSLQDYNYHVYQIKHNGLLQFLFKQLPHKLYFYMSTVCDLMWRNSQILNLSLTHIFHSDFQLWKLFYDNKAISWVSKLSNILEQSCNCLHI